MVIPTTKKVIALHQEEEGEMQNLGQKSRMQGIISCCIYYLLVTIFCNKLIKLSKYLFSIFLQILFEWQLLFWKLINILL